MGFSAPFFPLASKKEFFFFSFSLFFCARVRSPFKKGGSSWGKVK